MWQVVADLEQEVERVKTAHARLVRAAEGKLRDFGIPTEELGFLPQVVASGAGGAGGVGAGATAVGLLASRRGIGSSSSKAGGGGVGGVMGSNQPPAHHVPITQATVKA